MSKPLVSIALITYKHEKYIHETMKGILMQEGIEEFEIVVGDDKSPDRTKEILEEYAEKYKNLRFLERPSNVGMHQNWLDTIRGCNGKYIALIEGDDVWTDPQKLKKQVEIMEADETLSVCFTDAEVINEMEDGLEYDTYLKHQEIDQDKTRFTATDLCQQNFISTVTSLLRNSDNWNVSASYFKSPFVDWLIMMHCGLQGDLFKLSDVTSAYRVHPTGAFGYSEYEVRKINLIRTLGRLFGNMPSGKERKLVFANYMQSIEELAQHLNNISAADPNKYKRYDPKKANDEYRWLRNFQRLQRIFGRPVFSSKLDKWYRTSFA